MEWQPLALHLGPECLSGAISVPRCESRPGPRGKHLRRDVTARVLSVECVLTSLLLLFLYLFCFLLYFVFLPFFVFCIFVVFIPFLYFCCFLYLFYIFIVFIPFYYICCFIYFCCFLYFLYTVEAEGKMRLLFIYLFTYLFGVLVFFLVNKTASWFNDSDSLLRNYFLPSYAITADKND